MNDEGFILHFEKVVLPKWISIASFFTDVNVLHLWIIDHTPPLQLKKKWWIIASLRHKRYSNNKEISEKKKKN